MMLPHTTATRILRKERRGSSAPVYADTPLGEKFVKLRGSAQGTNALVAEIVGHELARALELPIPEMYIVTIGNDTPSADANDELADLLHMSTGDNLGFDVLEHAYPLRPEEVAEFNPDMAARILWLDLLLANVDRTPDNPNILTRGRRFWLIDFGASLPWQHNWSVVTEQSPQRSMAPERHLFSGALHHMHTWKALFAECITRNTLEQALALVPDSFLTQRNRDVDVARRRAAHVAYLWKRIRAL